MILGIDIGTYSTKICDESGKCNTFLSKTTQRMDFCEDDCITIGGKSYVIGNGEFNTDWNKATRGNTLILLFAALYKYSNDNFNDIVIGLPASQYKSGKDPLKEYILCNRIFNVNGRDLVIEKCEVACEGLSSYNGIQKEYIDKIGNNQCTIIDIGGRTTDVCIISNKKVKEVFSIKEGMLGIYSDITDYVSKKYRIELGLEQGEDIIINGLIVRNEQIDLGFIKPILKDTLFSILKEINLRVDINQGYILLSGGGSDTFYKAFTNRFKNIIKPSDSLYLNAKGYLRKGVATWQIQ